MTLEDAPTLQLGMTVRVSGTVNPGFTTGTASSVLSAADFRGSLSAISTGAGTFRVQGTTVSVDPATVFSGINDLLDLSNGDWVQVHGLPDLSGSLRATRIERLTGAASPILSGALANLDTSSKSFRVGAETVSYAGASFQDGLSASQLANGLKVRVRASAVQTTAGTVQAGRIQAWYSIPSQNGAMVNLSGVINDFASLASFKLMGTTVDASSARITGGQAQSIGNGVKVEIGGIMTNGVLVVSKLQIAHVPVTAGPVLFSAVGVVGAYVPPGNFKVQGQPVAASAGLTVFEGGTIANLKNGAKVTVSGSQVVNGVLYAERVVFNP